MIAFDNPLHARRRPCLQPRRRSGHELWCPGHDTRLTPVRPLVLRLLLADETRLEASHRLQKKSLALYHPSLDTYSTYNTERQPVIREMLAFTQTIVKSRASWESRSRFVLKLGVHCRWSSAVLDGLEIGELELTIAFEPTSVYEEGTPNRLHAGDRAPEAPRLVDDKSGAHTAMFDDFRPAYRTVVTFEPILAEAVRARGSKGAMCTIVVASPSVSTAPTRWRRPMATSL
jgi:hypothetical protein